jgi:hypothetical protein
LAPLLLEPLIEVTLGAGSFSFGLYYRPLGATAAVAGGGGGTLARREEAAVAEEPSELRGPPAVAPLVSEPAAGQEVYVQPDAQGPEYA